MVESIAKRSECKSWRKACAPGVANGFYISHALLHRAMV